MYKTIKTYYQDEFLCEIEATVLDVVENKIILDRTIAYPEGGGQIADTGFLCFEGKEIPFNDVQKGVGRILRIENFPLVSVDTPVYHFVDENCVKLFYSGQKVTIKIDVNRRIRTTVHHSALHMALMYACDLRQNLMKKIKGCRITTEYGRLDFSLIDKFTASDISYINEKMQNAIKNNLSIKTYHHENEYEAWYWQCENFICPCGGTHVQNTNQLGDIVVKRKNIGKNTERLIVVSSCDFFPKELYHKR